MIYRQRMNKIPGTLLHEAELIPIQYIDLNNLRGLECLKVENQVILAGTLKGIQVDIWCKVLAAFSTVKWL